MSHVNEVGAKLKSALDAVEEAKRALAELDVNDLNALSDSEYEDLEDFLMRMFLANMVGRMAGGKLRRTMELMRCSTERALWLLRDVENHVGRIKADSEGGGRFFRTRAGVFAQIDPRE